ncbi:hypothetical protein [Bradyrhizobium sp. CCBAU 25338]|uniref:hypothetical protein n=1 Tax=unclassified Bradyrhizobium TaxID=2631580 RepID=UPI0023025ACE|nr:hypothetical protein [Bradyrhizobium sp. CCBAU 25338]
MLLGRASRTDVAGICVGNAQTSIAPRASQVRLTGRSGSAEREPMVGRRSCAYSTNCMVDADNGIVVDIDAATAIRQVEMLVSGSTPGGAPKTEIAGC